MRCKCPFLLLSEKAKACVHMDEYYQCSDMEANPGSPESWCAGAIERQVSERATENACPVCRGEKEVYAGSSVPDGEGFVTCLCCNGSGVKPSPEEVWKLREENLRLSGDLHIAELELQAFKEHNGASSSLNCESCKTLLASCLLPGGKEIKDLLIVSRKVIDAHRKEAYVTCEETCWCWELDTAVTAMEAIVADYQHDVRGSKDGSDA